MAMRACVCARARVVGRATRTGSKIDGAEAMSICTHLGHPDLGTQLVPEPSKLHPEVVLVARSLLLQLFLEAVQEPLEGGRIRFPCKGLLHLAGVHAWRGSEPAQSFF